LAQGVRREFGGAESVGADVVTQVITEDGHLVSVEVHPVLEELREDGGIPSPIGDLHESRVSRSLARRRRARARWATLLVPPVCAFAFAVLLLYVAALRDRATRDFLSFAHWGRYDSGIYLGTAAHGFNLSQCVGPAYPPHSWCGTAGWAPLYPGLMWLLGHLGFMLGTAGMVLAAVFAYLTLQSVWVLIGPSWSFSKLCCLALAACFPGMVYYYALYPVSLLAFLSVVGLILFIRGHFLSAGITGAFCAWAFAVGPLIGVVFLLAALILHRGPSFWKVALQTTGVAFAGFAALLAFSQWTVGNWQAYFLIQAKYNNGLHDPVATFLSSFTGGPPAKYPLQDPSPAYQYLVPKAQTALVAALVIGLVVWTFRSRQVSRANWVILSYTVVFWIAPLLDGPTLGRYRLEALLVPCTALCTRLPRVIQIALVGTSAVLAVGLTSLFTRNVLW
jgi:hypothetical protein